MSDDRFNLVFQFLTDDPKYILGFELGIIYAKMEAEEDTIRAVIHSVNDEQLNVIAQNMKYDLTIEPLAKGWADVTLVRRGDRPSHRVEDFPR